MSVLLEWTLVSLDILAKSPAIVPERLSWRLQLLDVRLVTLDH